MKKDLSTNTPTSPETIVLTLSSEEKKAIEDHVSRFRVCGSLNDFILGAIKYTMQHDEQSQGRIIYQINKEGKRIGSFSSIKKASSETNVDYYSIRDCLRGKQKTAGGYRWEYSTQNSNVGTPPKRIQALTDNGEIVAEFPSIAEASRQTGAKQQSISCALNGHSKHCLGYVWKVVEEV